MNIFSNYFCIIYNTSWSAEDGIYCTFDLSKSLEHFQEKVTKILELTNIPEWNRQTFKLREKEIRESALILAGECIALLLHKLSKSQEFFTKQCRKLRDGGTIKRERLKILVRERNYILKAYRRRLLRYNEVASRKLPLGSGAVESLIRQVVNLRMKGNSKFWLQDNAEIMLHLRCQWIAKSWDNFSDAIFNSFIKPQTGW